MKPFIFFAAVVLYAFFAFEPPHVKVQIEADAVAHAAGVVTTKVADLWMR
ncbi:MAG: hypothetical protein AAB853_01475 [Patescibacteria group bacterium]